MRQIPEILSTETIARTRLFRIERVGLRFTNGTQVEYERMPGSQSGSVLIVPLLNADTLILVREYAVGTHRYEIGFPKGVIESEEDILMAANREIMEEIGYGAQQLHLLTSMTIAPGYIGHTTHVVLADKLYEHRLPGDEPEDIEVLTWRWADLPNLLSRDDFTEARSIAALFLAREYIHANPR